MSLAGVTENPSLPRERDNTSAKSPSTPRLPHENIMQQHNHHAATVTNNASRKPCMRNGEERKGAEVMHGAESRTGSTPNHRRSETPIQPMIRKNKRIPSPPVVRITKTSEAESREKWFEPTNSRSFEPFQKGPKGQPALSNDAFKTVREYFCRYTLIFQI